MKSLSLMALVAVPLMAQNSAPVGSINGTVTESTSGEPVAGATISLTATGVLRSDLLNKLRATTDSQGHYSVHEVPPGRYSFTASANKVRPGKRTVYVNPGQDMTGVDFQVVRPSSVAGKVTDENKEPLEGISVILIGKEYYLGGAHDYLKGLAVTNDKGEYSFRYLEPGRPYVLLAERRADQLPAKSDVPLNPKLRRVVPLPTYFPNSQSIDGAVPITLKPGEAQDGMDIKMTRAPSLCIEGMTLAAGAADSLTFEIEEQQPVIGSYSGGGYFINHPQGTSGKDGKIRICDLHSGQYLLTTYVAHDGTPVVFGVTPLSLGDHDVQDLRFASQPGFTIAGEMAWDGQPPDKPITTPINLSLMPLSRGRWIEEANPPKPTLPGNFTFESVLPDIYRFAVTVNAPGVYVKDITSDGRSIYNQPMDANALRSGGMRIVMARDGGGLTAHVADKDGNGVAEATVYVMRADAASEGALSSTLVSGTTDQNGDFQTAAPLPPGKYRVLASSTPIGVAANDVDRLWQARSKAIDVEVAPNGTAKVALELTVLETRR